MEALEVLVANKARRVTLARRAFTKAAGRQTRCMASGFSDGRLVECISVTGLQTSRKE